jgi:hypothetical protein
MEASRQALARVETRLTQPGDQAADDVAGPQARDEAYTGTTAADPPKPFRSDSG